ncbi:MAG: hypothetical protein H6891_01520 [Brucellaceae bacterium]|nr:hypothetical protein [Brucellaceae bacterium]
MRKRDAIYLALLVFVAAGMLIDWVVWPRAIPDFTPNDVVQMVGIIVLVSWWQIEDASGHGAFVSRAAKWMTIMFAPAGSAVYLVQSRGWSRALPVFLAFWLGVTAAALAGDLLGGWLSASGIL